MSNCFICLINVISIFHIVLGKSPPYTCGKYLSPLTGTLYNTLTPTGSETYLSWIVYLTQTLRDGLQELLNAFKQIECDTGCVSGKNDTTCTNCTDGNHCSGESNNCKCPSIVHCAPVHCLYYHFGFTYNSPLSLMGNANSKPVWKRQCNHFVTQLKDVINSGHFKSLLNCINTFLFYIRLPFILLLIFIWIIVIIYLSYGLLGPLDILHIRSYWRLARSHGITVRHLLNPLTTGDVPRLTM